MDLKIFEFGKFTEVEFNTFCNDNIIFKYHIIDCGHIYMFFKNPADLGKRPIEAIEECDRMIKQCQTEIMAGDIDIQNSTTDAERLEEMKKKFNTSDKQWKSYDDSIKSIKNNIALQQETIGDRKRKIEFIKNFAKEILTK